ncbi:hypothetical protein PG997_006997 [Apiospora hydei]|uniref:Uncharacterized protein n=1 Tax=Apiospora hydei TaxID=1337664 RepID=A0ABR1WQC0_9PEZI
MPLYTKLPETIGEVDVIIAGGGTAGCVVASRLADADPEMSILVIEGGSNNQMPTVEYPACFLSHLAPDSKTNNFYMTKKAPDAGTGCSSRPQRSDWDAWNTPGWSADEMIPYLKKHETYYGNDDKGLHGHDGPIGVSDGTYISHRIVDEFAAAAEAMGWPKVDDPGLGSVNAIWRLKKFIGPEGKRQDAATCYLHPRLRDGKHPNLHVLVESQILDRAGVPLVADLPGVGTGYEDNQMLGYPYLNNLSLTDTLDGLVFGRMGSHKELMKSNHKMMGWNGQEMQSKLRPTDAEVAALGPEFQKAWDRDFPTDPRLATGDPCLAVTAFTVYPYSRGQVHITGPNLDDPVDFETGFFADPDQLDIKKHIWLYKKQREAIRRMPAYRGEMARFHPPFAADSGTALVELAADAAPIPRDAPETQYTPEDDAVLEKWLRENVGTTWHSLGTCKMRPRDQEGVVDPELGVYGVQGLKIADMSIAPRNVSANTCDTALAIGEKAADLFIKELGMSSA